MSAARREKAMAVQLSEVRTVDGCACASFAGMIDPEWVATATRMFDELWAVCRDAGTPRLLMDVRMCTMHLGLIDRYDLGVALAGHALAGMRVAVLGREAQATPERFFETVARNRGAIVRVFVDRAPAVAWLREGIGESAAGGA